MNKIKMLKISKNFKWESFLLFLLVTEIVTFGFINPKMFDPFVLLGSVNDYIPICFISLFVTFVLITGGMDIQAGSIVGLVSISIGVLWAEFNVNIWVACLIGILIGILCGVFSGIIVAYAGVQPMVVTLGGSFLYSGIAIAVTNISSTKAYQGISGFPSLFIRLAKGSFFGVPYQLFTFLVLVFVTQFILSKTKYGRKVYLTGVNRKAAEYSGINTSWVIVSTYALSGVGAALAGIYLTGYLGTAKADFGNELTLAIITAVVLGGTLISGGRGSVIGTALAALVIGILRFGLALSGVGTQYLEIPVGILLITALILRSLSGVDYSKRFNYFKKKDKKIKIQGEILK